MNDIKHQIIKILENISLLLQIKGESYFKFSAYSNAAEILKGNDFNIEQLVKEQKLSGINGIGDALNKKITDYILNGKMDYYEKLKAEYPESLLDMLKIEGLGPKKVNQIFSELKLSNIVELEKAANSGELIKLKGFSKKIIETVLNSINQIKQYDNYKERKIDFDKIQ
ncbi:MAG: hypothetical protein KIT33_11065 [Candidatus Kapabacteria bacterium]|nr:hypothetical protein [Ignavibacteriota bacterium]MCW5885497.1 hypothetical protein [Candidatus Kapabacteria bacterium]